MKSSSHSPDSDTPQAAASWFVGIDVSKAELAVAVRGHDSARPVRLCANSPAAIKGLLRDLARLASPPAVAVCMESTASGLWMPLAQALHQAGHPVYVINPACIKSFMCGILQRNKTDHADAAAIAEFIRRMPARTWRPRPRVREQLRQAVRGRDVLVRNLGDMKRRIKSGSCDYVEATFRQVCADLKKNIKAMERDIDAIAASCEDLHHIVELLDSISGVGRITACAVAAEVDFERFDNARQLCAYIGTSPARRQSGASAGSTRISKQGNSFLRRLVYMGALSAMRHNPHIKACAERWQSQQTKGNGRPLTGKQAACASMNKLVRLMFGVVKSQQPYQANAV